MRVSCLQSTATFHSSSLRCASTELALPRMSPKKAAIRVDPGLAGASIGVLRKPACAWNDQWTHPDTASSAYRKPESEPMNTFPSTIVGCPYIDDAPGIPKAHFISRRETEAGVSPA